MVTTVPEQSEMKKPRLVKTKIVACYFLFLWLLGLLWSATVSLSQLPFEMIVMFLCMSGFAMLMLKPWFLAMIVFQPVFPILFLIFRRYWLQFMGMIYHLAVAGFMIFVTCVCFYYYWHFDEIERDDNSGILELLPFVQGSMSISTAVIFIAFAVMLYFDCRKQKKWDLMSGKLIK